MLDKLNRMWYNKRAPVWTVSKIIKIRQAKKLEKSFEKRLTNEIKYDIMDKLSSRAPNEVRWNAD